MLAALGGSKVSGLHLTDALRSDSPGKLIGRRRASIRRAVAMSVSMLEHVKASYARGGVIMKIEVDDLTRSALDKKARIESEPVHQRLMQISDELKGLIAESGCITDSHKEDAYLDAIGSISMLDYVLFGGYDEQEFDALMEHRAQKLAFDRATQREGVRSCAL